MKPSLQVRLSQHLALTPQLQQSIRLLQLSTLELHQEVEQMLAQNPIDYLSPAEKYDLYIGRTDFPLTNYELKRTGIRTKKNIPEWEGICHYWAPASYLFDEPGPITVS